MKRKSAPDPEDNHECESSMSPSPSQRKKVRWEGKSRVTATTTVDSDESSGEESENSTSSQKGNFFNGLMFSVCYMLFSTAASDASTDSIDTLPSGRLGCAYYEPIKRILFVMEDTQETAYFDLMRMLLEQVDPDVVLTSSKADDGFIEMINDFMETANGIFQICPFKEFIPSKGRNKLLSLSRLSNFPDESDDIPPSSETESSSSRPNNAYDFMRCRREITGDPTAIRWNASIRLANFASIETSPLCLGSIGALLDYILRERALSALDDEGIEGLDIKDIEILCLDQVMQINADALLSLQVFEDESHASVHSDKTKEGLSLFGILNNTKTTQGRSLLRTWLLRPSLSVSEIRSRHDAVECFMRAENLTTANALHNHLKGVKNVPRIMGLMKDGKAKLADWQGLVKFTFHATMLRDSLSELHRASEVKVIKKLMSVLDLATFKEIGIKINQLVDWEDSSNNDRVCVRPHIDEDLDNRKHVYHGIDDVLSTVAKQICEIIPFGFTTSLNVVYFPQLGYLICVPMLDEWRTESGVQPLEGWTFQPWDELLTFVSSNVYFKSQEMHGKYFHMDHHIGDLHSTIVDRELEIIQGLLEDVLECDGAVRAACDVCSELDCLLSFAEASRLYEYRRPEIVSENSIEIIQGRHPLHERVVDTFVANDARVRGGAGIAADVAFPDNEQWNSILLCTGANACGKSVYLKQVALIQIMAQIGCFVPAVSARLGVVDKLFTRVSTRESVSKVQSAFMIDLAQVSLALRNCTARSLLLLDEFGKGTLSTDGTGLFCGVLQHLLNRGANCPKVLVATHFHDVFNEDILDPEHVPVSFRHMQVMFTSSTGATVESSFVCDSTSAASPAPSAGTLANSMNLRPTDKITYLYRVAEGLSLNSHAAKCAEIFGIPTLTVERAEYVTDLLSSHMLNVLLDEKMSDVERSDLEDAEAVCRRFLAWNLKEVEVLREGYVKTKLGEILRSMDIDAS
ncbi:muts domain V-domain-containing protein [Gymnopilus junonius]|uniref:Muts domain V-domain-containing protein n=1 Tax=Gymnopilus junonius TaxID=109634 RepID=A0A9P5TJY5_GYMJU|nr:muts domain V-domain-containing protein [Gymnopilus junonius]